MIYIREDTWHDDLEKYIISKLLIPFEWGKHDCVQFTAGAVLAMTGIDALQGVSKYKTKIGALKAIKRAGGLYKAVNDTLTEYPIEERPVSGANRGDVILFEMEEETRLGIAYDSASIITTAELGVAYVDLHQHGKNRWSI